MYKVIESQPMEENTELRLAEINKDYSVGLWDLDAGEYVGNLRIWPYTLDNAKELATAYFNMKKEQGQ